MKFMISALSLKDRIEMANADDDEVEVYRVGFLAYGRARAGMNTPCTRRPWTPSCIALGISTRSERGDREHN